MMRVVIDGVVYRRNWFGGIARYWTEILKALAKGDMGIQFDLILPPGSSWPKGVPYLVAGRLPALWATRQASLFHTTY